MYVFMEKYGKLSLNYHQTDQIHLVSCTCSFVADEVDNGCSLLVVMVTLVTTFIGQGQLTICIPETCRNNEKKYKQCLLNTHPSTTVMVNKENYYREYKMAKFDKQSLCQKYFFGTTLLHAHAHYISIVGAKYQKPSVKALVQVDFLILSKHKQNPLFNRKQEKMAKFTKPSFCQKLIFWHQISSHKCSMCPYNAITQNICFVKGSHKYDVYLRDKNKAHLNQIKTVF